MDGTNPEQAPRDEAIETLTKLMIERFDYVDQELGAIRSELRSLRRDDDDLSERSSEMSGFAKEIDAVLEPVRKLEAHLGLAR